MVPGPPQTKSGTGYNYVETLCNISYNMPYCLSIHIHKEWRRWMISFEVNFLSVKVIWITLSKKQKQEEDVKCVWDGERCGIGRRWVLFGSSQYTNSHNFLVINWYDWFHQLSSYHKICLVATLFIDPYALSSSEKMETLLVDGPRWCKLLQTTREKQKQNLLNDYIFISVNRPLIVNLVILSHQTIRTGKEYVFYDWNLK